MTWSYLGWKVSYTLLWHSQTYSLKCPIHYYDEAIPWIESVLLRGNSSGGNLEEEKSLLRGKVGLNLRKVSFRGKSSLSLGKANFSAEKLDLASEKCLFRGKVHFPLEKTLFFHFSAEKLTFPPKVTFPPKIHFSSSKFPSDELPLSVLSNH